jgi:hypothetical protein
MEFKGSIECIGSKLGSLELGQEGWGRRVGADASNSPNPNRVLLRC